MIRKILDYCFIYACAMGVCLGLTFCILPWVGPLLEPLLFKAATNFCAEMPSWKIPSEIPAGVFWMGLVMIAVSIITPLGLRWSGQLDKAEK